MDPKQKFWLFKQSNHFCAVPWNHVEIWSDGGVKTCSKGGVLGNINLEPLDKILFSDELKQIKSDLLNNRLISNCTKCHNLSVPGEHFDLRNHYNPMFKSFDINYNDVSSFQLNAIDLHWDNTCNLKCIYCTPDHSSAIANEQKISTVRNNTQNIDDLIELVLKNQYHMKEIYLSGGEPLLIKQNTKLLEQLTNTDLPLRINSNISMSNLESNPVFNQVKRFKNVLWTLSAEATGNRFDYIRTGASWGQFLINLEKIKTLNHNIRLNLVYFIGSAYEIFDVIEFFIQEKNITDITINQLNRHSSLLVRNAPEKVKLLAAEKLKKLLESGLVNVNSNSYYNLIRCNQELDLPAADTQGYKEYFNGLDAMRGTNWRTAFPELNV